MRLRQRESIVVIWVDYGGLSCNEPYPTDCFVRLCGNFCRHSKAIVAVLHQAFTVCPGNLQNNVCCVGVGSKSELAGGTSAQLL